jgi:hypothetical protein
MGNRSKLISKEFKIPYHTVTPTGAVGVNTKRPFNSIDGQKGKKNKLFSTPMNNFKKRTAMILKAERRESPGESGTEIRDTSTIDMILKAAPFLEVLSLLTSRPQYMTS